MTENLNLLMLVESFQEAVNQHNKDWWIQSFSAEIPPDSVRYNNDVWQKFLPWFSENYPDEYSKMFTSEGQFIYNRENGAGIVPLLRKWRQEQKE